MCRFLLYRSKVELPLNPLLEKFSLMAERSRSPDGDRQGDGWGACWWSRGRWEGYRSLEPVWRDSWRSVPSGTHLVLHARSSSFPDQRGVVEFNQPFFGREGSWAFVFNGLLRGVTLPPGLPGRIGSERLFALLGVYLKRFPPKQALEKLCELLGGRVREEAALNVAIATRERFYVLNKYSGSGEYYRLFFRESPEGVLISSEPLEGLELDPLPRGRVLAL